MGSTEPTMLLLELFSVLSCSLTCWVHFICAPTLETRNEETSVCTKKKPKLKVHSLIFLHSFVRNTKFKTILKICFCCFFHLRYLNKLAMPSAFPIKILEEFCCHTFLYENSFTFNLSTVLPIPHIFFQNFY